MLGFAVLDRRREIAAVWLVSRTDAAAADSTNAVVLDLTQPDSLAQLHALTRDRIVVATPETVVADLPLTRPHEITLVAEFIAATQEHQQAIIKAVNDYTASRKSKLTAPTFPSNAELPTEWAESPEHRALALAQVIARAWTVWLISDGERLRRTSQPRTGVSPWIMPTELNQAELVALPLSMAADLTPEPIEAYPG